MKANFRSWFLALAIKALAVPVEEPSAASSAGIRCV